MTEKTIILIDKLVECEEKVINLSKIYNIELIHLRKLYNDMSKKLKFTRPTIVDIIGDDLSNGLNINQIIIKYNLDKNLI